MLVPGRLRADWREEWEAELRYREELLAQWDRLDRRNKLDLLRRSLGAFRDALLLQPRRLKDEMFQDLRFGVRMLLKNPGFTIVLVVTLALGIGANTALFSVVNGVLLNPLPYPKPEQLVTLHQSNLNFETYAIPYPNFRDWKKENRTCSAMAVSRPFDFTLTGMGDAERINGQFVTADFFSVLGVNPQLGRSFAPGEDEFGRGPVALISADLWQRKFGSEPHALGKSITLDERSYTIVGVIPANFNLQVSNFRNSDVYLPIGQWDNPALKNRNFALGIHGIGRLKPGVTIEQAQADLNRVMQNLAAAYPETNRGKTAKLVPLKQRIVGDIGLLLWLLLGAVGFVLLIACVNVSNLLLARSTARTREFAIRAALGARRWRLLRQSLTESTLLAMAGGGLGLLFAGLGSQAAISLLPTTLPRAEEVRLDGRVLLFTVAISLLTGIISGLAPALKTSQRFLAETLKEGGRGVRGGRVRAQGVFVAVEMALALVLLIGAGLMIRSLNKLWKIDPGFRPDNVLTFDLNFPPSISTGQTATPEAIRANLRELSDQISTTPGIQAASFSRGAFPLLWEDDGFFWLDSQPKPASQSEMNMTLVYLVEPDYLTAMGISLKHGRFFTDRDDNRSPNVAVIDEVFASKYFGAENPIDRRIHMDGINEPARIIGVVGHVNQGNIGRDDKEPLQAQIYLPSRRMGNAVSSVRVVARFEGLAPALLDSIRRVVQSKNSQIVISSSQTMNEAIAGSLATQQFSMTLLNAFALVALLLASVGLYGVISYLVGQRTHELGIRIALGAGRKDVLRLILDDGMKMALGGVALGLVAALGLIRLLGNLLYRVSATDPATFTVIVLLLMTVTMAACFVPAWRATKIDPISALRHE